MNEITFQTFPKLSRLSKEIFITEKIDGTNAQIIITDDGQIGAGSRTRLLTPGKTTDNFGFATWVQDNKEELLKLGPGRHFGEWFGQGIQRGYGLAERRFALFNVDRWAANPELPSCVSVVPLIGYYSQFDTSFIQETFELLEKYGSFINNWDKPEGIVVYHKASGLMFKRTFEHDGGKWLSAA